MAVIAQPDQTKIARPRAVRGPGCLAPQAFALRRRVGRDHGPITVAEPVPQGGTFNVLVLLDQPGRAQEAVDALVDRVGPQLGQPVLCVPIGAGAKWGRVATTIEQLRGDVEGTPFGARVLRPS